MLDHVDKHPSYGQIRISRVTSSRRTPLYGTSNECRETIELSIYTSDHHRELSRDWHFANQEIIRVEMSPSQFAEMITSLNIGSGTPVTIKKLQGQQVEEPPYKNDRDLFDQEFKTKVDGVMAGMNELISDAESIGTQRAISKKDVSYLLNQLKGIRQEIEYALCGSILLRAHGECGKSEGGGLDGLPLTDLPFSGSERLH